MEIARNLYLDRLINRMDNSMVKVITGIRRCGKSYLLFNLFYNYLLSQKVKKSHIIKIALDNIENAGLREPLALYNHVKKQIKDSKKYYILLDEVQLVSNFEEVLNSFLHFTNVDVFVTGSNAKFLSKDIITEFRGRGDQVHIAPLSFSEYFSAVKDGKDKYEAFRDYALYGGLPLVALMNDHEQKSSYLKNVMEETYLKDIINRNKIKHTSELSEILDILSSSIGCLTNPTKLSNTYKSVKNVSMSPNTIASYIDFFEDSFIIQKAKRYDVKGKKYIDSPFKYYFSDMGLRNARLNFRQVEETHILENIIYNELIFRGFDVDVGVVTTFAKDENQNRSKKNLEVDFVCNKGSKRFYIQSALSLPTVEKFRQETLSLEKINDSFKKIIITKDNVHTHFSKQGFLVMNVFDFLLDLDSFERY